MANLNEYARTREDSTIGKIIVDRDLCIAAVSCIAAADTTFELDGENIVIVKEGGANAADDATLLLAAESCPTKAIILVDKAGSQVFPK
jgi:ferredoxin